MHSLCIFEFEGFEYNNIALHAYLVHIAHFFIVKFSFFMTCSFPHPTSLLLFPQNSRFSFIEWLNKIELIPKKLVNKIEANWLISVSCLKRAKWKWYQNLEVLKVSFLYDFQELQNCYVGDMMVNTIQKCDGSEFCLKVWMSLKVLCKWFGFELWCMVLDHFRLVK